MKKSQLGMLNTHFVPALTLEVNGHLSFMTFRDT